MTHTRLPRTLGRIALTAAATAALALTVGVAAQASTNSISTASYRSPTCLTSQLGGALVSDGGGTAGAEQDAIQLTNTGKHACTLQGWPGVSLVGHHNGTQIGAAADQNRHTIHPAVTIAAHGSALAPLLIAQALNFPTPTCKPVPTDGFRVYPPGERYSLFVKASGITGCASTKAHLLTISAIRPLH